MARNLALSSPMSAGDIVGRSFRIFRQNILVIAKILVLPTILICLGRISVLVGASYGAKSVAHVGTSAAWFGLAGLGGIVLLSGGLLMLMRSLALTRFLTGFTATYKEGESYVLGRIGSLVLVFIATFMSAIFLTVGWGVLSVVSAMTLKGTGLMPVIGSFGIATAILGMILSLVFISLVNMLVSTAVALEPKERELSSLIAEGLSLTFRSFWRSLGFVSISFIAITLVAYPMTLPMILIIVTYMLLHGAALGSSADMTNLPIYIQVMNSVWETVVNMLISPIYYLAYALYYCDLRMRQEGLDLVQRIDEIEEVESVGRLSLGY